MASVDLRNEALSPGYNQLQLILTVFSHTSPFWFRAGSPLCFHGLSVPLDGKFLESKVRILFDLMSPKTARL